MEIKDKVIIVTGAANGIGEALCRRFVQEKADAVVMTDIEGDRLKGVADELGALAITVDVRKESDIIHAVEETENRFGRVDLFCSNAGVGDADVPGWTAASSPNEIWQKQWEIHVMSHVYAARAVLPGMIKRGEGYLLNTSSAAGLLNQIGCAAYSATKHAAVGYAESLAITHGSDGIRVSVLCPQAVRTRLVEDSEEGSAAVDGTMEPEDVAECVVQALAEERFMILPHEEVATYFQRKASDYGRWINGMQRLKEKVLPYMIEQMKKKFSGS